MGMNGQSVYHYDNDEETTIEKEIFFKYDYLIICDLFQKNYVMITKMGE